MEIKLHALLAVNSNLAGQATKVRTELQKTLKAKGLAKLTDLERAALGL